MRSSEAPDSAFGADSLLRARSAGTLGGTDRFEVERSDGSRLTIDNYSEHLATAFVFLSSRSPETRLALETIRAVNDRTRRRGVMFAGIFPNPAESGEEMLRFCQASGFVFPCYRDPARKAARTLGATVTPEAFLLDSAGKVIYKGGIAGLEKAVDDVIAKRPVAVASTAAIRNADRPARPAAAVRGFARQPHLLLGADLREHSRRARSTTLRASRKPPTATCW